MDFTNETLDKVDAARKTINEFTAEVLKRAKAWLEANYTGNYELPAPHIIFEKDWVIELVDLDKVLNGPAGAPIQFVYYNRDLQPLRLTFSVPEDTIFHGRTETTTND